MARRALKQLAINADVWAESGGSIGMFGKLWRQGRLNIVSHELTPTEQTKLDAALRRRGAAFLPRDKE